MPVRVPGALELELQTVGSSLWVLETESRSSGRAASALNPWAISPGLWSLLLMIKTQAG